MKPGVLTTEIVVTVKLTLVHPEKAISDKSAREVTAPWIKTTLEAAAQKVRGNGEIEVTVMPRSHMIYDLRGLDMGIGDPS
jgi:hypothetical protein